MALARRKDDVYSPSLNREETNSIKRQHLTGSILPFDLIHDILIRLPVKVLLRFLCVCKSWKSLIFDPKFTKKHLSLSTRHSLHCFQEKEMLINRHIMSYSYDSVINDVITTEIFKFYDTWNNYDTYFVGSCNGILCFTYKIANSIHIQLWNPSIRKFKKLPCLQLLSRHTKSMYGFGYDPINDNYKVVVLPISRAVQNNKVIKIHTLGTNLWKSIPMFPFLRVGVELRGKYVSGTTNWLAYKSKDPKNRQYFIASFDLRNESYREILPPDCGEVDLNLSVFKDCLCIGAGTDIWVMKEYGNKESWTKLFTIPYLRRSFTRSSSSSYFYLRVIHVFDDDQVLMESVRDAPYIYIFYNLKNYTTSKSIRFENSLEVCIESLISPNF